MFNHYEGRRKSVREWAFFFGRNLRTAAIVFDPECLQNRIVNPRYTTTRLNAAPENQGWAVS